MCVEMRDRCTAPAFHISQKPNPYMLTFQIWDIEENIVEKKIGKC
jgi:hypothetical protein